MHSYFGTVVITIVHSKQNNINFYHYCCHQRRHHISLGLLPVNLGVQREKVAFTVWLNWVTTCSRSEWHAHTNVVEHPYRPKGSLRCGVVRHVASFFPHTARRRNSTHPVWTNLNAQSLNWRPTGSAAAFCQDGTLSHVVGLANPATKALPENAYSHYTAHTQRG